jgi:hypothetical protein
MRRSEARVVQEAKRNLFEKGKAISRLLGYNGAYPKIFV